jgi:branched-chain amino acid transport system permease protein
MVGAVVGVLMTVLLSNYTPAWHMYLGLLFVLVVVYAPGGLTSIGGALQGLLRQGLKPKSLHKFLIAVGCVLLAFTSTVAVLEMLYQRVSPTTSDLILFGVKLDPELSMTWVVALLSMFVGVISVKPSLHWVMHDEHKLRTTPNGQKGVAA